MMFDVWRLKEQGWLLPRFRSCMVPPVRAILRVREQQDQDLNRHIRVGELLDPRSRQSLHDFPPMLDVTLVALDETSMTITGTERVRDPRADREYLYAQSWFLRAVMPAELPENVRRTRGVQWRQSAGFRFHVDSDGEKSRGLARSKYLFLHA